MTEPLDPVQALLGPLAPALVATGLESVERVTIIPGRSIEVALRGDQPLRLEAPAAEQVLADLTDRFRQQSDGVGIDGSPHRLVFLRGPGGKVAGAIIRFVRPTLGIAEPLRDLLDAGKHLVVLGAAGPLRTDLLRDAARILAEPVRRIVAMVDLFGELGGPAPSPSYALGQAVRLYAGTRDEQVRVLAKLGVDIAPDAVVVARVATVREVEALRILAMEGVQVVMGLPCWQLMQCVAWEVAYPLLGLQRDASGTAPAVRISIPTVGAIVELLPQAVITVHTDVTEAIDEAPRGRALRPQLRDLGRRVQAGGLQRPMSGRDPKNSGDSFGASKSGEQFNASAIRRP